MSLDIVIDAQVVEIGKIFPDTTRCMEACLDLVTASSLLELERRLDFWLAQLYAPDMWSVFVRDDGKTLPLVLMQGKVPGYQDQADREARAVYLSLRTESRLLGRLELSFGAGERQPPESLTGLPQLATALSSRMDRLYLEIQSMAQSAELALARSMMHTATPISCEPGLNELAGVVLRHLGVTSLHLLFRRPNPGGFSWGMSRCRSSLPLTLAECNSVFRLMEFAFEQGVSDLQPYLLWRSDQPREQERQHALPSLARLQSIGFVPIVSAGVLSGVIIVGEERSWTRHPITHRAITFCAMLADSIAKGLAQGGLLEDLSDIGSFTHALLDSLDDAVLLTVDDHINSWNQAAHNLFGYNAEEVLGRRLVDILPTLPDLRDDSGHTQIVGKPTWSFEWKMHTIGERELPLQCRATRLSGPQAGTATVMYVFTETGQERELEYLKDDLLSIVSHELRTPLNGIYGFGRMLLERPHMPEAMRREALHSLHASTERLTRMADDFIDVARARRYRLPLHLEQVDVTQVVRAAVREAKQRHPDHEIGLRIQNGLPSVQADSLRLKQILDNLVSNAAKYSSEGTRISLYVRRRREVIAISVSDEGPGIPEAIRDRIFEPFFRGNKPREQRTSGAGLGLSIVKSLVQAHGGQVTLRSIDGRGTTFTLTLPVLVSPRRFEDEGTGSGQ